MAPLTLDTSDKEKLKITSNREEKKEETSATEDACLIGGTYAPELLYGHQDTAVNES